MSETNLAFTTPTQSFPKGIFISSALDKTSSEVRNALMQCITNILGSKFFSISNVNVRPNSTVGFINHGKNKLFFKVSTFDQINREIQGQKIISNSGFSTPTIKGYEKYRNLGVLIQARLPISNKFTLYDIIKQNNSKINVSDLFDLLLTSTTTTLTEECNTGANDLFFFARIQSSGKIHQEYQNSTFSLHQYSVPFSALSKARFIVDGIEYKESFEELLNLFATVLSPQNNRPMWISHGDLVESNIYYDQTRSRWGLLDFEVTGLNWAITDLITPLVGFGYMFDHTLVNYSKESLYNSYNPQIDKPSLQKLLTTALIKTRKSGELMIVIDNVRGFQTSSKRKFICFEFINRFLLPALKVFKPKENLYSYPLDLQMRAAFFMRLFGTHTILSWNENDQTRAIGLIIKLCATKKIELHHSLKLLQRFYNGSTKF
jgi:hypothetical protein